MTASKQLSDIAKNYNVMTVERKLIFLNKAYHEEKLSWEEISDITGKSRTALTTFAKKHGFKSRSRSENQSLYLNSTDNHPTKGRQRTAEEKRKTSQALIERSLNMGPEEREKLSEKSKKSYNKMTKEQKEDFHKKGMSAVQGTSKTGSKLEKDIMGRLIEAGFTVDFHKERFIVREKLQLDLFIPEINTAIEVDGPMHHLPVFGQEKLRKNQRTDKDKTGLVLGGGMVLIRVKQVGTLTMSMSKNLCDQVVNAVLGVKKKFPTGANRLIEIGVDYL